MLALLDAAPESALDIDGRDITRLDSAGAMMLSRYAVKVGLGLATVEVQPQYQPDRPLRSHTSRMERSPESDMPTAS
jgi:hypothetical protein